MRKFIIVTAAILATTYAFANAQSLGFSKNSPQLKSLGAAFKVHPTVAPKINPNDITMGYAGADVSRRPTISSHTTTA
ncbi:MAG: hypothetical protein KIT56_03380 [Gammaproteobacteria bacterium]|nr:hypothetical protein [Gammaproteobacteria bacterium]MCW5582919.1 hypothetical protein [Gammaproteobacteria bacterium]